ncbi:MAG: NAD(P)H-dependent oxidoreductase [Burkholderiales bacterium]|nr:NAD(P)H-dependent oxidoreductase [Nitrosomonas sp.]MCP5276258.1 NAD(P)H-dependent oxidoreductase [Burkholderiales bacterium]
MTKRITLIQGHPDAQTRHFCHALANAYQKGAESKGHAVRCIDVATIDFPILRSKQDFDTGVPSDPIKQAQDAMRWANHLVIIYPLWLGTMPALLKAFFEQTFRPGFAFEFDAPGQMPKKNLTGKSARIIVSMGMPAFVYRWFFFAHGLKMLERNILSFSGIGPIKTSLIGSIEDLSENKRQEWLHTMLQLGKSGS